MRSPSAHPQLAVAAALIYLAMSAMLFVACRRASRRGGHSNLWLALALLQLFFAADALLGIRLVVSEAGREFFEHHGWYENRLPFQIGLAIVALLVSLMFTKRFMRMMRDASAGFRATVMGSGVLLAMFLLSSISLHELQGFGTAIVGRTAGCVLTGWGAWQGIRRPD